MKGRPVRERLGFAVAGIVEVYRREQSFRIYVRVLAATLVVLAVLRPPLIWCAALALVAALVFAFEMVNAALEHLIDLLHPAIHPEIKAVKDMASGAVLVVGCAASIVAACTIVEVAPRRVAEWTRAAR